MSMVKNKRAIALKSYSQRANYLGLLALVSPEVLYYFWAIDLNPSLMWWTALTLLIAGTVGRYISQKGMTDV
jgi:hypothetical protein